MTDAPPAPAPAADAGARGRRSFLLSLVALAVGAGLLLLASGRTWATTSVGGGDLPTVTVALTGSDLMAGGAVALLVLAGIAGLAATRRAGRVVIGALLVLAGVGSAVVAGEFGTTWSSTSGFGGTIRGIVVDRIGTEGHGTTTVTPWWLAVLVAGLLVLLGGVLAIVTSGSWPQMGRRYERGDGADTPARDLRPRSAWDQLDEGIDPTVEPADGRAGDTATDPTLGAGGEA